MLTLFLSSFLHVHPDGMVASSSAPSPPRAAFLRIPAIPCHQVVLCLYFHRRGSCRGDKVHAEGTCPCLPCPPQVAQEQAHGSAGGQLESRCPARGVAVWHGGGSSWRGPVVSSDAQSCRRVLTSDLKATYAPAKHGNKD